MAMYNSISLIKKSNDLLEEWDKLEIRVIKELNEFQIKNKIIKNHLENLKTEVDNLLNKLKER